LIVVVLSFYKVVRNFNRPVPPSAHARLQAQLNFVNAMNLLQELSVPSPLPQVPQNVPVGLPSELFDTDTDRMHDWWERAHQLTVETGTRRRR
jgi:hypothetical protein